MECFAKVSSDGKAIISKAVGKLDEKTYLLLRNKIADLIKNTNAKHILVDISHAIVAASVMQIYQIAASSLRMFPIGFKYAIVYSEKTMTEENAIFGETVARNRGGLVKVFRDISEAKKWLAITEIESE
jgi:hypothetical protein